MHIKKLRPLRAASMTLALFAFCVVSIWATGPSGPTLFYATFNDLEDGPPVDGSFAAEIGEVLTFAADDKSWAEVAPQAGIATHQLLFTDLGGDSGVDFGVECESYRATEKSVVITFAVSIEDEGVAFLAEVTDSTGMDISRIKYGTDGNIRVNGKPSTVEFTCHTSYQVEVQLLRDIDGKDMYFILITDRSTGLIIGMWTGEIPGEYDNVARLVFTKLGGSEGAILLDTIKVKEVNEK